MRTEDAERELRGFATSRGVDVGTADAETIVRTMIEWYKSTRADDVVEYDGDMLLFQWGTHDYGHSEPEFYFDMTRQFIVDGPVGDDAFFHLRWNASFTPTEFSRRTGMEPHWCESPDKVGDWLPFVLGTDAAVHAMSRKPERTTLDFFPAG